MIPRKQPEDTAQLGNKVDLGMEKENGDKAEVVKGEKGSKSEVKEGGVEDGRAKSREAKRDLWDEAYEALRKTDSKLVEKYKDILFKSSGESCLRVFLYHILLKRIEHVGIKNGNYPRSSEGFAPVGEEDRQTQLSNLLSAQTAYIEESKMVINVAGHLFGVRKAVYKVTWLIGEAKDVIGKALPDEPHCQLA